MGIITAERFNSIKARVKSEMNRRNGYGSMAAFGGADYDFTSVPAKDGIILKEHGQKTVDLLRNINQSDGLEETNLIVQDLDKVEEVLSKYEQESMTGSSSSCGGACSGLCTTTCSGTCSGGCSGGCSTGCYGSCSEWCASCYTACGSSCLGYCDGSCTESCSGSCSTVCTGTCTGTCTGSCSGGCTSNCSGTEEVIELPPEEGVA